MAAESARVVATRVARLLNTFETQTAFKRLDGIITEIKQGEFKLADHRNCISSAKTTMETIEAKLTAAGLDGKNEAERKANLLLACQDDALYMRAFSELTEHQHQLGLDETRADRSKREYRVCMLEIEARISSKYLVAASLKAQFSGNQSQGSTE